MPSNIVFSWRYWLNRQSSSSVVVLVVLVVCGLLASAPAKEPQAVLPQVYIDTTWNPPVGGTTWAAHTSAQLSTAITKSSPGDIIVLDAGATYSGNFVLPAKTNS